MSPSYLAPKTQWNAPIIGVPCTLESGLCRSDMVGSDGSFSPSSHTQRTPSLDFISTGSWDGGSQTSPSQGDRSETHDADDNCYRMHKGIEKEPLEIKLRSASRKPKKLREKLAVAPKIQQARNCHNNVEKQYRTRLKERFEKLLLALKETVPPQDGMSDTDYCWSRGEVLDAATQRILSLREEKKSLTCRVEELSQMLKMRYGKEYVRQ